MDFVIGLLVLSNRKSKTYDSILVIVNKLSKMVYYILVKVNKNALGLVDVIIESVI